MKKIAVAGALAVLFASPLAFAESDLNIATPGPTSATARLDFQVIIPRVLFLQVGTGSASPQADNLAIDLITFTVPAANLGSGLNVAGTGGDAGPGAVNVRLWGNGGNITLGATTASGANLVTTAGDALPWTEITVTATAGAGTPGNAGYIAAIIPHPTLNGAATVVAAGANKVIRQHGVWTFAYDNTAVYAAGTYGGVGINNGRITYTATMP